MKIETLTIAIPVLNGGDLLAQTLEAIAAQRNSSGVKVELLIVDSGSSDGSDRLAERHGARLLRIDKADFSHGGTRNMLVAEATGEAVALLTQDSTPAGDGWLDAIVEGFSLADDVALVFGPHLPRPEHGHVVRRELAEHFKTWESEAGGPQLQRLGESAEARAAYERDPGALQFFSDVNGAVAKWAWERVPYREVPYSEDQLLGREMIEAGFAKVFSPGAAVIHSHEYSTLDSLKRYFDEYRGLREVLGYKVPLGVRSKLRAIVGLTRRDRAFLRAEGVGGAALAGPTLHSLVHHTLRVTGEMLGGRADRLPDWLTRRLSLEGRAGFAPVDAQVRW